MHYKFEVFLFPFQESPPCADNYRVSEAALFHNKKGGPGLPQKRKTPAENVVKRPRVH